MIKITHRFVETNGIRMHIAEEGTGPLVLLLHGFPEIWYSWRHQIAPLAEAGFHVVAPDQRGYGETDRPIESDQYTSLHLAGDVLGLMDALGEQSAFIAGHDWGATVAWETTLMRPDRVHAAIALSVPYSTRGKVSRLKAARAILGDGFYMNYFQTPGVAEAEFEHNIRVTMRKFLYYGSGSAPAGATSLVVPKGRGWLEGSPNPEVLPAWLTEADVDHYTMAFEKTGFTGGLNWYRMIDKSWELMAPWHQTTIKPPVLFLAGERDAVLQPPIGQQRLDTMKRFVPNLRALSLLPGAGHWVQQERPTEVSAALLEFLRSF